MLTVLIYIYIILLVTPQHRILTLTLRYEMRAKLCALDTTLFLTA